MLSPDARRTASPGAAPRRVLIVEDDRAARTALAGLCRLYGLEPLPAGTLAEGMNLIASAPDLLILDLMLPDGNGVEVLRRVRSEGLVTRVAVVTAMSGGPVLDEVRRLSPALLLPKPIDIHRLRAWLSAP